MDGDGYGDTRMEIYQTHTHTHTHAYIYIYASRVGSHSGVRNDTYIHEIYIYPSTLCHTPRIGLYTRVRNQSINIYPSTSVGGCPINQSRFD
jgi:hypothetical protein